MSLVPDALKENESTVEQVPEPNNPPCVRVVHAAVKGRARLEINGLYRSEPLRRKVESALAVEPQIRRVEANILTGRVLILFDPRWTVEEITSAVETLLDGHLSSPAEQNFSENSRHPSSPAMVSSCDSPASEHHRVEWHALPANIALESLGSSKRSGLSPTSAQHKLQRFGPNTLPQAPPRSSLSIFLGQFKSLPVLLLGASALLSAATGGLADAAIILGVVLINAGTGYITEAGAERTINALDHITKQQALVIRDAQLQELDAESLVPGDILMLMPGARVAADARLLECRNLMVDESALTGESMPVVKAVDILRTADVPLADRFNMVYMGTMVTGGSGMAVVVGTGRHTEIGTIQALISETRSPETPMQRQLRVLGNQMVMLSGGICGLVFLIGMARGYGWLQMLKTSISLAVAAVPEGLPTVATTTLALGIRNMRRDKVLVRHLDAVETLGAMQVICLDKTGTLTLNRMSVLALYSGNRRFTPASNTLHDDYLKTEVRRTEELRRLMYVAVLCNETELNGAEGRYELKGSPTENALVHLALAAGVDVPSLRERFPRIGVEYRAEKRNYMRTIHIAQGQGKFVAVKGSPSEVLDMCSWWLRDGERLPLTESDRTAILIENDRMAGKAMRVLGFAYAEPIQGDEAPSEGLIWLGLTGMADPLREGMKELIALFHRAGIDTIMITGDQSATAYAIGKELELSRSGELNILDSTHLEQMDPDVLAGLAQKVNIFSRVSPANKLEIIQALQRGGKVAAMTGDGINDGPALRAADIGVAMGAAGTDAARSVADVVLEDDNLHTMIVAVSEGRTIYNNIRKSVHFLTATNLSEILVMLTSIGAGLGTPLTTMQLLWINLVTDIFPALALSVEPPEPDVLSRPPRDPREAIVRSSDFKRYGFESLAITAGSMGSYGYALARYGIGPQASSVVFTTMTMSQLLHAYSCRSDQNSIFSREALSPNPYLNWALGGTAVLQLMSFAIPGLRRLLGVVLPSPADAVVIGAGAALPFLMNEATKKREGRKA